MRAMVLISISIKCFDEANLHTAIFCEWQKSASTIFLRDARQSVNEIIFLAPFFTSSNQHARAKPGRKNDFSGN